MTDIESMNLSEMTVFLKELGEPSFRAKQVFQWLHRGAVSFDAMTNLSGTAEKVIGLLRDFRSLCRTKTSLCPGRNHQILMASKRWKLHRNRFDALSSWEYCLHLLTGGMQNGLCILCIYPGGKVRDLTPAEMLDQVLFTQLDAGFPVSNIVLMGIGEPLDNLNNVLRFLELNRPEGLNIGMRHISLSTCGLVEKIDKLAEHRLQLTLSVSLHAPDDETRSQIMPVNRSVGVEKLFETCRRYFRRLAGESPMSML